MSFYRFISIIKRYQYKDLIKIIEMKQNNVSNKIISQKMKIDNSDIDIIDDMNKDFNGDLIRIIKTIKKDYINMRN